MRWLWKYVDGAKTAGELYGRALVVIAAEQYASRLVVPTSQRTHPTRWASHKDLAAKALQKLAGPHLPASLKQLEQAIARAQHEYDTAMQQHASGRAAQQRSEQTGASEEHVDVGEEPGTMMTTAPSTTSWSSPTRISNRAAAVQSGS